MQTIKSEYKLEDSIKKSRFIGILFPCQSEVDIAKALQQCQLTYPNASHIAFAYRIKTTNGFISRFNDAGEPSGTAGKPIFQYLEGNNLINVLLTVIRYFGGVKLGAGGLTRAYGNTAKQVIETAELLPYIEQIEQILTLDYKELPMLGYQLKKLDGKIINQNFTEQVQLSIELPKANLNAFLQLYSGYIHLKSD